MKILHLIYTTGISGAEKYLKHLLPGLKAHGINCHLIIVCPARAAGTLAGYCKALNDLGVPTSIMISRRVTFILAARKIAGYLKKKGIKILHAHLLNTDLLASLVKTFFYPRLFLISTKHGYQEKVLQQYEPGKHIKLNDLYYHITKFTLRKIDVNIAVSKGIAELFYNLKISKTVFPFIHHGILVEPFDAAQYRAECRKADPQLIIVGRIELFKGHRFLIEALPAVIKLFPAVKLLVLGEGSEKEHCIAQTEKLGISNHVEFLGFKPHPYSYIKHSDIIILPSLFEPFGLVYIEAFALKTPVVAFDTPAGNEIMENGLTALLVNKADSKALAEQIIYLLQNESERENLSERAFAKYEQAFTTEKMVTKTANWYLSLGLID